MLGKYGHRTVRILKRATPTVSRDIRYNGHLQGPVRVTLTRVAERLAMELSLPVLRT